jgi:lipoprotein-releasing system ATP-binding protein
MANIIELKNINKIYGEEIKTQVLFDINLNFKNASFNSIIGQSGSGKSTLLNIIGTLDKPTSGNIIINGTDTTDMNKNELAELRNETLGFIFQFHYLLPEYTALENVLLPYQIKHKKVDRKTLNRANELLELTGLSNVKNNLSTKMSGGQQQRTAIARALINNPKIILADEPTGNLDTASTDNIYKIMRDINKETDTSFVIITHDKKIAERTNRIIEIIDGKISMDIEK